MRASERTASTTESFETAAQRESLSLVKEVLPNVEVREVLAGPNRNDLDRIRTRRVGQWHNLRKDPGNGNKGPSEFRKSIIEAIASIGVSAALLMILPQLITVGIATALFGLTLLGFTAGRLMRAGWHSGGGDHFKQEAGAQSMAMGLFMSGLMILGTVYSGGSYAIVRLIATGAGILSGFLLPTVFVDRRPPVD